MKAISSENTVKKYTAKDKMLFEKLVSLEQKYTEYKKKYDELEQN